VALDLATIWSALESQPAEICAFYQALPEAARNAADAVFEEHRTQCSYAALGDSYSAGEGVSPYFPGTDVPLLNTCHRSTRAYPTFVTRPGIRFHEEDFLACSGAVTDNVVSDGSSPANGSNEPPQLDKQYHPQTEPNSWIVADHTDMVTLTLGGNDVGFADVITKCLLNFDCSSDSFRPGAPADPRSLRQLTSDKIAYLRDFALGGVYGQILLFAPDAAVFALGYPHLVPEIVNPLLSGDCGGLATRLSEPERAMIRDLTQELNDAVAAFAAGAGVHFVSVREHFTGHEACSLSGSDWLWGTRTVVNIRSWFHPNAAGQREYAKPLAAYISSRLAQGAEVLPSGLPKNPAPTAGRAMAAAGAAFPGLAFGELVVVPEPTPSCDTRGFLVPGQSARVIGGGFAAGASLTLRLKASEGSYDVTLGTTFADAAGDLSALVTIPPEAPTSGLALFEALGLTTSGNPLLLSGLAGLGPSLSTDSDGDGLSDLCDPCPEVASPNQADGDADGVGDVCDACPADGDNDLDRDGACAEADPCPLDPANDLDADGVCDGSDNCPLDFNPGQEDSDVDGRGDACEACGDGTRDANEECDDGNPLSSDGCSALCQAEVSWWFGGVAQGGTISFRVDGVALSLMSEAGETPEEVVAKIVAAINLAPALRAAGTTAMAVGPRVSTIGSLTHVRVTDPGLLQGGFPVPVLTTGARILLAALTLLLPLFVARSFRSSLDSASCDEQRL
jgi:cysteine-rich repeat protein